jgi:hypothetical protein
MRPSYALTSIVHEALREDAQNELYVTVSDLILQFLEPAMALLDAWHAHQPRPGSRQRATPPADPPAPETAAGPDQPENLPATPPRRRPGRSDTDA